MKQRINLLAELRAKFTRGRMWTIALVLVLFSYGWFTWFSQEVQARRTALLVQPLPLPSWILALYPFPGTEVITEHYAKADDVFFTSTGDICVQLDAASLQMDEPDATNIRLSLNGLPVRAISFGRLLYGPWLRDGLISFNASKRTPGALNMCWEIDTLKAGDYLGVLEMQTKTGSYLNYEWAFRLTQP